MDWFYSFWLLGMSIGAWLTRKKQDEWTMSKRLHDRLGLDAQYYERVSTGIALVCAVVGVVFLSRAIGLT